MATSKIKTAYFCSECGAEHLKWQGQCRECAAWNSLIEENRPARKKSSHLRVLPSRQKISEISGESLHGWKTGIAEFDRVLGGQLLPGMTVLLGGEPGIGKSTLLLQAAERYSSIGLQVLYLTGEESLPQIKMRSERLAITGTNITVVNTTELNEIINLLADGSYSIVLIDSVQTISSSQFDSPPGTIAQVREAANQLIRLAKAQSFSLFLVGHVTKEGLVAGPKVLEHMVDTVIYFEGDSSKLYRVLRATKNRFGSVAEMGLFEMNSSGLEEVANPSSFFLGHKSGTPRTGAAVTGFCEGQRPLLVEVQALVTQANYGNPQRVAGGIDNKKLALLIAILEKRADYPMATNDVFISVAGGLRVLEPALDLAILVAIVSSLRNIFIAPDTLILGEVGLSGEIRAVTNIDQLVAEATRLGFKSVIIPQANNSGLSANSAIEIIPVADVQAVMDHLFG